MSEHNDAAGQGEIAKEIESAEKQIPAPEAASADGHPRPYLKKFARAIQYILLLAAFVYVYASLPGLRHAFAPERPIRSGPYSADPATDECIRNIWSIAAGNRKPDSLFCPLSGTPYRSEAGRISCPSPEKHGLRALFFMPRKGVVAQSGEIK